VRKLWVAIVFVVAASALFLLAAPQADAAVRRALPRPGAISPTPPLLRWRFVPGAERYNVQLYRGGKKILSRWPTRARFQLRWSWRYGGHRYRLRPAIYRWYVWPWFGSRYGRLRVRSWFVRGVPPLNVSPPKITGSAREKASLTAAPGAWTGTRPIRFSYEWRRCNRNNGVCTAVPGATSPTITLGAGDVDSRLAVVVKARNLARSRSAVSAPTSVVLPARPRNVSRPVMFGRFQQGRTVSAVVGNWTSSRPLAYSLRWQRCNRAGRSCVGINGGENGRYTLRPLDVAARVRVVVRATNSGGSTQAFSATSPVVGLVLIGTPAGDVIRGSLGADVIRAWAGDDVVVGLAGNDRLSGGPGRDRVFGGPGDDRIFVRRGERDFVDCSLGLDRVVADARDRVAPTCEVVSRRGRPRRSCA
jgi:hypothetical protein